MIYCMEFGELTIFDFSGFRFYYGRTHQAHILIETPTMFVDLHSMQCYDREKIHALIRLSNPEINYIHDNLEVRLDKRIVEDIVGKFPDYAVALREQLEKMSIYASNLRFHLGPLLLKIQEILSDYSRTNYHRTAEGKKHFLSHVISNFDQYLKLDELPLNWVNFIDCLVQYPTTKPVFIVNTWRSFLVLQNHKDSGYASMYYPYSKQLLRRFEEDITVQMLHLEEKNIDDVLEPLKCRIHNSAITTTNPVRTI